MGGDSVETSTAGQSAGADMKRPDRLWDWLAKRYDRQAQAAEDLVWAVERFAKYLDVDDTVLDFACGTGVVSLMIASDVKQVHAIDTSARMIQLGEQRARARNAANVHFARRTIFDDDLGSASCDVILAINILHLLEDARAAVQRAAELLRPGGRLVAMTPCLGEARAVARIFLPLVGKLGVLSYMRTFTISNAKDMISDGGFDILEFEVTEGAIPSCLVVARKRS